MEDKGKIIAIKVKEGSKIILEWFALKVEESQNFAMLFETIIEASHKGNVGGRFLKPIELKDSHYTKCQIIDLNSNTVEVGWQLPVVETLNTFNSSRVQFEIENKEAGKSVCSTDAFSKLFEGQKKLEALKSQLKYPSKFGQAPVTRGDWRLKNDFIDLLKEENIGFMKAEETVGKTIVNDVCDCLFYILPHLKVLHQRCITLDPFFDRFYDKNSLTQNYNDRTKYGNTVKRIEKAKLESFIQNLYRTLALPCMSVSRMAPLKKCVFSMAQELTKYVEYLTAQNKRSLDLHELPHPARLPDDGVSTRLRHIPAKSRSAANISRYAELEKAVFEMPNYEPVSLADYWPENRKKRFHYLQDLQLPFDVTYYQYSRGGPYENLCFVWKCPNYLDLQQANKVIHNIEKDINVHHTRAMRREFYSRFSLICKTSPTVLNEMYRFLTQDNSAIDNATSKEVNKRLLALVDTQDPDIVYDLRVLHRSGNTSFDRFFEEVENFLNEFELKATDDRRHGLVSHMSVAISVRDLHEQICKRLPVDGVNIPSEEYLRLQFMPPNPSFATAMQYRGRFSLKHRILSRQYNISHIDAHYVSALQKYLKEFAVKFRDNCVLLSVDDKNHIPVGEPGVPIATIYRSKKTVVHSDVHHLAADHDTSSKMKLTPSVTLQIEIPKRADGDFYNGKVCVTLKDTIFQPSNPIRHIAETRQFLGHNGNLGKPIVLIYSDGGPDHRITYPSVKLALISMFLIDDCDYLLAMRTAPHQSYRNWVERIMSILNLGLQTVALERKKMSDDMEKIMKTLGTMSSIRKKSEQNEDFKSALQDSIDPVINSLNSIFSRLQLKENKFSIGTPASEALMSELWETMHQLDPDVKSTETQTKQIEKHPVLKAFLDHCTVSRKYFFLIRKCGKKCQTCRPPRLETDIFKSLFDMPDPEPKPDDPSKYKTFDEVFGTSTSEKYCPSLKHMLYMPLDGEQKQLPNIRMTAETVRDFVVCTDCSKPRCIYATKKLTTDERIGIEQLKEDVIYTCGGVFIPEDHHLFDSILIQPNVTCAAPVCSHYFSNRTSFPAVCYNCGSPELHEISYELKMKFQTVHPVCVSCKSEDVKERTRGAKKLKK